MKYQDTWINGQLAEKGIRECAPRYEIIKSFCKNNFAQSFTVLDIGANMGYFAIRLIEDFGCFVTAFEFHMYKERLKIIAKNKANTLKNLSFINHKISLNDLNIMSKSCHYDLALMLSVAHHLSGDTIQWIEAVRKISDNLIMEFALTDSKRTAIRTNYSIPTESKILGYGISHKVKDFKRPIILLKGN